MTLQPTADRREVLYGGGYFGPEAVFLDEIPGQYSTATSGGGSVTASPSGAQVTAGTTVDDIAAIRAPEVALSNSDSIIGPNEYVTVIGFSLPSTGTPYTDQALIGTWESSRERGGNGAVGIDLQTEEFYNSNTNTALSTSIPADTRINYRVTFTKDGNTKHELQGHDGSNIETVTQSGTPFGDRRGQGPVYIQSDGGGEQVNVKYHGAYYTTGL